MIGQQMLSPAAGMGGRSWWQRLTGKGYAPWAVQYGPFVLGLASLAFSLYSANAIRWVFSGLGVTDRITSVMVWVIAGAFGVTGYFITRCLAFRMMSKGRIRAYILICVLIETVEVGCNLLEALEAMQHSSQFSGFPPGVHTTITILVCVMWSCVPFISIGLAVMDMDLEREKRGLIGQPQAVAAGGLAPSGMPTGSRSSMGPQPMPSYPTMPMAPKSPMSPQPASSYPSMPAAARSGQGAAVVPPFVPAGTVH